ncbi:MAG TPA: LacI family DNA-binding transcriptional regulator [Aquaticitalea sp.]|nr:LacI family DNA-binding transcriptional regulator [Aquaticitalea sp.]
MVTLKQLAEKLNVSVSTVSKALHESDEISKETIERVKTLAKQLNYQPNKVAISLKSNKTHTIGVIIPNILNHFFAKVLYGIEEEATKNGYDIIICISNESNAKELQSLEVLGNGSVDGFIMSIAEETQVQNQTQHIESILQHDLPVVMFDRVSDTIDCDKVIIDDFGAAYEATQYLLREGRKHIVLLSDIEELSVGKLRVNGYLQALHEDASYANEPIILHIDNTQNVEESIETLLQDNPTIDGILSIDNTTGVVALHKAIKRGINVPKDLSIIGFSDENVLPFTDPKLSTISQHAIGIGKASVNLLIDRLSKKYNTETVTKTIKTNLIHRSTTNQEHPKPF